MNAPHTFNQLIAQQYDNVPYISNAFPFTSPRHLRATAHLYGVDTPPVENARVLELGCASGGNLFPFALAYPAATVVGVDLAPNQIADGQQLIREMGVKNMQLHAMSLTEITPAFGEFDYIIVHGVFSWVPPDVRQAILRVCKENLSENGMACISYNTYPGWKAGEIVRDAMLMNCHGAASDEERLARAKAMLGMFSEGMAGQNALGPALGDAARKLQGMADDYLTHEYLETFNSPCYFVEFAQMADEQGLRYVGDAEAQGEVVGAYGPQVYRHQEAVAQGQSKIMRQQYLDFSVGRTFRKSLLMRGSSRQQPLDTPDLHKLVDLRVAGCFTSQSVDASADNGVLRFRNQSGRDVHTNDKAVLAVTHALSRAWPAARSFDELVLELAPDQEEKTILDTCASISTALKNLFILGVLALAREAGPYDVAQTVTPALIPGGVALAKAQTEGRYTTGMFNLWHESVRLLLKPAELFLLTQMAGENTEAQLRSLLCDALREGRVPANDGGSLKGQRNLEPVAGQMIRALFEILQERAMLQRRAPR
ncbi:methyltransferase regulatory domain-containing protein [Achromobacter marplatensis]